MWDSACGDDDVCALANNGWFLCRWNLGVPHVTRESEFKQRYVVVLPVVPAKPLRKTIKSSAKHEKLLAYQCNNSYMLMLSI
jgi:hypothetical protein